MFSKKRSSLQMDFGFYDFFSKKRYSLEKRSHFGFVLDFVILVSEKKTSNLAKKQEKWSLHLNLSSIFDEFSAKRGKTEL